MEILQGSEKHNISVNRAEQEKYGTFVDKAKGTVSLWVFPNIDVTIDIIQQIADALQKVYN